MSELLTAYTELQIDDDSISLTLITEGMDGVTIEDTERFTFEELEEMAGRHESLSLSQSTRESLSSDVSILNDEPTGADPDGTVDVATGQVERTTEGGPDLPAVGDRLVDKSPPSWADNAEVRVTDMSAAGMTAGEYVIEENLFGPDKTVATENPEYPSDDPVVIASPKGTDKEYAYPLSRLRPYEGLGELFMSEN